MAKIGVAVTKYVIKAKISANGVVERPDVIGAIFGQTEGLLGEGLELRELQMSGRIGRIEVRISSLNGKSEGTIEIPTSLNREDTALIAAALETIDRIGPCNATIAVESVSDVRSKKRDFVVGRAKSILQKMSEGAPESDELGERVKESVRVAGIQEQGPDKLAGGPNVGTAAELILVEGRADVITLLKAGLKNALEISGTNIPKSLADLCKGKKLIAFLDGDRGGDLILKELSQLVKVDFVARAPSGKEVEELTQKEILQQLRNKTPFALAKPMRPFAVAKPVKPVARVPPRTPTGAPPRMPTRTIAPKPIARKPFQPQKPFFKPKLDAPEFKVLGKIAKNMQGSGNASLLKQTNQNFREVGKIPKRELPGVLEKLQEGKAQALILDWDIDQTLIDEAASKGIKYLIGARRPRTLKRKPGMIVLEMRDFKDITPKGGVKK